MSTTLYSLHLPSAQLKSLPLTNLTAMYRDVVNDTLFIAYSTDAKSLFSATLRDSGTWKKRIVTEKYETYSWLYVESDFLDGDGTTAASVTVTVANAAGTTLATNVVSSRDPVRVTAFREKEVIVTVSGKARTTRVTYASSAAELKAL